MNAPFDHGGYRFYQASFEPLGSARQITISFVPVGGGTPREVTIPRRGSVEVDGVGRVAYVNFYPDFVVNGGVPATATGEYNNPVAHLLITSPDGETSPAFAFNAAVAEQFYAQAKSDAGRQLLASGNRILLRDFEKVGASHTLSVQYDPGRMPVYAGFVLLTLSLCGVFFFSHRRVWAVVEPADEGAKIYFGGDTNRGKPEFEKRFDALVGCAKRAVEAGQGE